MDEFSPTPSLQHNSFRRKKNTDISEAHTISVGNTSAGGGFQFDVNTLFTKEQNLMNPLFEHVS